MPCILATCRANQTTLTPLLHSLALTSLTRHISPEKAVTFHSATPIDLRPFIQGNQQPGGTKNLSGVHATVQSHDFSAHTIAALREAPSTADIWKIAADLRRSTRQHETARGQCAKGRRHEHAWLGDLLAEIWYSKVGQPRQSTWEVSNIGLMPREYGEKKEKTGGRKIQAPLMSQGAMVAGTAISISVAGVAGGVWCQHCAEMARRCCREGNRP